MSVACGQMHAAAVTEERGCGCGALATKRARAPILRADLCGDLEMFAARFVMLAASSLRRCGVDLGASQQLRVGPRRCAGEIDADEAGEGGVWRIGGCDGGLRGDDVVTTDDRPWTLGSGAHGQLEHGDTDRKLVPTLLVAESSTGPRSQWWRRAETPHSMAPPLYKRLSI
jgi:hypothetical protein